MAIPEGHAEAPTGVESWGPYHRIELRWTRFDSAGRLTANCRVCFMRYSGVLFYGRFWLPLAPQGAVIPAYAPQVPCDDGSAQLSERFDPLVVSCDGCFVLCHDRLSGGTETSGVIEASLAHHEGVSQVLWRRAGHAHRWPSGGLHGHAQARWALLQAVHQGCAQGLHRPQGIRITQRPHAFPQQTLTSPCGPDGWPHGTTALRGLVHHACEQPPHGQHDRQRLLAMSVVLRHVRALVFQRLEGRVCDLPPRPPPRMRWYPFRVHTRRSVPQRPCWTL